MHPWAKLHRECMSGRGRACRARCGCVVSGRLSLVGHSADVAAVVQALLERPVIAARLAALLGQPALSAGDRTRLVALTALHDVGKVNLGFQSGPFQHRLARAGHIGPMLVLLKGANHAATQAWQCLLGAGGLGRFAHLLEGAGGMWEPFQAALAHHGSLPDDAGRADPRLWQPRDGYDPVQACRVLVDAIATWLPEALDPVPIAWTPAFGHAFAGLLTLADWLGSDEEIFAFAPDDAGRFAWALPLARKLIERRSLAPERARTQAQGCTWEPLALIGHALPSAAQAAMLGLPAVPSQGRLCVIEDETGSGKTEAALVHFLDLFRAGHVDGMYFALPTRAAARQIHARIAAGLRRLLGPQAPHVTLAVPGYVDSAAETLADPAVLHPDDSAELRRDALWSSERPKRYLASWVAVGTVDQALLGGLQVRHAQLRSAAMLRLLLVVDEVHGSDIYMAAILRNLLDQHRRAGGHALLMSATLGASARARYFKLTGRVTLPTHAEAVGAPYPVVWSDGAPMPNPPERVTSRKPRVVGVELDAAWERTAALVARAAQAARRGARVLVIRNTVRLVIETQRALEAAAPELSLAIETPGGRVACPHHARYAPEDRLRLDAALEAALGRDAPRERGSVTVASQTAEQSLDIDADLLIADLCPADVLLQRIGRLHRHARPRPAGFEQPLVIVLAPPEEALAACIQANGEVSRGPLALGLVYPDLLAALATRRALATRPVLRIPEANRALVEAATHEGELADLAGELGGVWFAHWAFVIGQSIARSRTAARVQLKWCDPIASLPSASLEEQVRTRLGLDDRTVLLPEGTIGPFGGAILTLSLRGHWLKGVLIEAEPTIARDAAGELAISLGGKAFVYDRLGLRPADGSQALPRNTGACSLMP